MNKDIGIEYIMLSIQQHATGGIKGNKTDISGPDNETRNKRLSAQLLYSGYEVITVHGSYIENLGTTGSLEVDIPWFFVIDFKNKMTLKNNLKELGREYEQDSVLYIPSGGKFAYILGLDDLNSPESEREFRTSDHKLGLKHGTLLSKLPDRPFIFKKSFEKLQPSDSLMGRWALSLMAKSELKK